MDGDWKIGINNRKKSAQKHDVNELLTAHLASARLDIGFETINKQKK